MEYALYALLALAAAAALFLLYKQLAPRFAGRDRRKLDMQIVKLSQAIRRNPNDSTLFTKRGIVRFRKKDTKGALEDLDHALTLDADNTEAHYHLGCVLRGMGNDRAAMKEFQWVREHSEDPYYQTAVRDQIKSLRG